MARASKEEKVKDLNSPIHQEIRPQNPSVVFQRQGSRSVFSAAPQKYGRQLRKESRTPARYAAESQMVRLQAACLPRQNEKRLSGFSGNDHSSIQIQHQTGDHSEKYAGFVRHRFDRFDSRSRVDEPGQRSETDARWNLRSSCTQQGQRWTVGLAGPVGIYRVLCARGLRQ